MLQKETDWQTNFFVKTLGTLFCSAIDPLLIHFLWPLDSNANKTEVEKGLVIVRWKEKSKDNEISETDNLFVDTEVVANEQTKTVDFSMTKARDMKFNRRLYVPKAAPEKLESNLQQFREAMDKTFDNYKHEHADKNGNLLENNLTNNQIQSVVQFRERIKNVGVLQWPPIKHPG